MDIVSSRERRIALALVVLVLVWFGVTAPPQDLFLANTIAVTTIAAIGLNMLMGTAGLISLGHGAFVATGAFVAAGLEISRGWPLIPSTIAAVFAAAAVGLVTALPALRLRGLYVALVTLGVHFLVVYFARQYQSGVAQGAGLELEPVTLLQTDRSWFVVFVVAAALGLVLYANLLRTRWGRALQAVRDRDIAAAITGVDVRATKLRAFTASAAFAGFAGALLAHYLGTVSIEQFSLTLSIHYVAVVVIGGPNSVMGTAFGAAFVTLLPRWVDSVIDALPAGDLVDRLEASIFDVKAALFGVSIVVFLLFEPGGLAAIWGRVRQFFALWPFSRRHGFIGGPR